VGGRESFECNTLQGIFVDVHIDKLPAEKIQELKAYLGSFMKSLDTIVRIEFL
jgi:hypothetical protein